MSFSNRELRHLRDRINRVSIAKQTPSLRMVIVREDQSESIPSSTELTQWDMVCVIEKNE